jgi:hypothetical protein
MLTSSLDECEPFRKGRDICNQLFDDEAVDFGLDCSQFLVKYGKTNTETPWYQDQSYYPSSIPDLRAANVWLALGDGKAEMGCKCYKPTPLESRKLHPHFVRPLRVQGTKKQNKRKPTEGRKLVFLLKNRGAFNKKQKEVVRLEVYIEG